MAVMKKSPSQLGFTLMEMIILMVIIAVLAAMALPGADDYAADNRLSAATSDLMAAMQTARSEAVGRNAPVTLCASNAAKDDCRDAAEWEQGWLVFVDGNGDGDIDSGEEVLQYHDPVGGKVTLRGTAGLNQPLTFFPSGRTSISSTQTFIVCDERGFGDDARGMVVSILGRASAMKASATSQDACIP